MLARGVILAGALLVAGGPALATDYSDMMYSPHPMSGYLELGAGGWGAKLEENPGGSFTSKATVFDAAARLGFGISPNISGQVDVWSVMQSRLAGSTATQIQAWGAAVHFSWRKMQGGLIGVFVSTGTRQFAESLFGAVGLEAVHNYGNFRISGQVGTAAGIDGDAADISDRDNYVAGTLSYFFHPNLVLTGLLGFDQRTYTSSGGPTINNTSWGARLEYKPDDGPASFFVAYRGRYYTGDTNFPSTFNGVYHQVTGGVRFFYDSNNQTSLRQMANSVGLIDMNGLYGELHAP